MLFGTSTLGIYTYFLANMDNITVTEAKNYLLIIPMLAIFGCCEAWGEAKWVARTGAKTIFKSIKFISIKFYRTIKFKRLKRKAKQNKPLTNKQKNWILKNYPKKEEQPNDGK